MPTGTRGNIHFQAQLVLQQLGTDGVTDRTPDERLALADRVDQIHRTSIQDHSPPRTAQGCPLGCS